MADGKFIGYDPSKPVGERLGAHAIAEIQAVAPSAVTNGSLTTAKYKDESVTGPKLAPGAVDGTKVAVGAISATHMAADAVGTNAVENDAITPAKVATGIPTTVDSTGAYIETVFKHLTAAEYAALDPPDPNTDYFITA